MQFVVRTYIRQSDSSITPKEIRSVKDQIFDCYKEILEFHKDILLKNFQTLSKEPGKIGKLFIRMQPNFSNHSKYCRNLPKALEILDENSDVAEYFNVCFICLCSNDFNVCLSFANCLSIPILTKIQNYSVKIRDEKPLSDRLKVSRHSMSIKICRLLLINYFIIFFDSQIDIFFRIKNSYHYNVWMIISYY